MENSLKFSQSYDNEIIFNMKISIMNHMSRHESDSNKVVLRYNHCVGVSSICEYMAEKEKADIYILKLAGLAHDWCKFENKEFHASMSAIKTREYLLNAGIKEDICDSVCRVILTHDRKDTRNKDLSIEQRILIEADIIEHLMFVTELKDDNLFNEYAQKYLFKAKTAMSKHVIDTNTGKILTRIFMYKIKNKLKDKPTKK